MKAASVTVSARGSRLCGDLSLPDDARGVVLFAHGTGSSRRSPRNRAVAARLQEAGMATLLIDLLTEEEEREERRTGHLRFDIQLLTERLSAALDRLGSDRATRRLPVGCFGASTGAAAALALAGARPEQVRAVVSRGGRPDLTPDDLLARVRAPTLLIVGELEKPVILFNRDALMRIQAEARLEIVPGAGHLFEEPGALERVADLAADWFARHLTEDPDGGDR